MRFRVGTLLLLVVLSLGACAQNFRPNLRLWNRIHILKAKICAYSISSTKQEQDLIFYCNLARLDGQLFVKTILKPYLEAKGDTDMSDPYISSLIAELNRLPRLKPLRSSWQLSKMAKDYALRSGKEGIVGHKNFDQRFSLLYRSGWTVGENCAYRQKNALDAVIDLLIDQDEPRLGHRKNILSPDFTKLGVGIASHRDYDNVWVIEFIGR